VTCRLSARNEQASCVDGPHMHQGKHWQERAILPLPLREGAGGWGGTSTDRGRGIRGRLEFVAPPPSPQPPPARGGGGLFSGVVLILMRMGLVPAMTGGTTGEGHWSRPVLHSHAVAYGPRREWWSLPHNPGISAGRARGGATPLLGRSTAVQAVRGRASAAGRDRQHRSCRDDQNDEIDPHYTTRFSSASPAASRR
jgi:hypothetical protein